jgi:hypothetical protein
MDKGFEIFLNWQTAVLCLGIYLFTHTIRRIVEVSWPGVKTNRYYREVFLPAGPIGNGLLLAFVAKKFPWPEPLAYSLSARLMYGAICGLASGWFYTRFRSFLKSKAAGVPSISPPSGPDVPNLEVPKPGPLPNLSNDPPALAEDDKTPPMGT